MSQSATAEPAPDLDALTGKRLGPYNSFNPVSEVQIWQWCSALGDHNPLYLDADYRARNGIETPLAPPAMMQMWTMRDVNLTYASGSTSDAPYEIFDTLSDYGFPANVAVSYDITFHRYLCVGERAHHYTTVVDISPLKTTAIGRGHFVTERVEYLDQQESLFAEALITYFQYCPLEQQADGEPTAPGAVKLAEQAWVSDFSDVRSDQLSTRQALPELAIPITHKLIVSGAAASQDYIDVHHNAPAARAAAMPDIFMNILTTCGLTGRYLTDWAGPGSRLEKLSFKLMAPNTPGDTMVMQGQVADLEGERVQVQFAGRNGRGYHLTGTATLRLAGG